MMEAFTDRHTIQKLALRMKQGDLVAASRVYELLMRQTYGFYVSRIRDREHAQDLTQDVFMRLVRSIQQYDASKGDFVVWYWKMVRNMLIDFFRKGKTSAITDIESLPESAIPAGDKDVTEELDEKNRRSLLYECLQGLEEEERELFELRFISELPYSDIAAIVGKNEGALRVAVNRIKKKLEAIVKDHT
ncbi:hypothetical protein A2755_00480 [Candidatus Wolfebacteria bacterium RIFCSPHIGHO2_01_FULL_48_22]|uniref:RNA polymerase sigma-70 region 2 domain-containing protein n=2 Tax=Candidatus Wolfeibacteriota TaxID=1752735 RepID=A0A1F8DTN0_9BACT|nr:MAG: hypothetical protein A2755_00480 [Candidatus Wolfebacteria bacterium RIFCSPHIGHO2_01_FULL_48_22]OGM93753.1 MAG: hypothetical protein A2935_03145 [Candidatus Wolfebacteria bacterium RIFCSPLOWO2_01_FULL_47_17b]